MTDKPKTYWTYRGNFIPRLLQVEAIVLWPFVLFRAEKPRIQTIAHEFIHMEQIERDGAFVFYLTYIFEYLKGLFEFKDHYRAYRNISYEIEAFTRQSEFALELQEKFPEHYS